MKKIKKQLTISFIIITSITFFIWLFNKIIYLFVDKDSFNHHSTSYYYQWKFGKIHYNVVGKGSPILFIHSTHNGTSSIEFNKMATKLASNYTVYSIDLLGYGKSDKPRFTYTAYLYVQIISDFIKNVIKEPCDIITNGKSNAYVSMLALQDSDIVKKLIYINPADLDELSMNPTKTDKILKHFIETPLLGKTYYNLISSKRIIKKQFNELYINAYSSLYNSYTDQFYKNNHNGFGNERFTFSSTYCKYANVNIKDAIHSINHSIYIIQGSKVDRNIEKIYADYKTINSSIEYSIINNVKEFPHIENPYETFEVIKLYLS